MKIRIAISILVMAIIACGFASLATAPVSGYDSGYPLETTEPVIIEPTKEPMTKEPIPYKQGFIMPIMQPMPMVTTMPPKAVVSVSKPVSAVKAVMVYHRSLNVVAIMQ
jgi:hypothetical protein